MDALDTILGRRSIRKYTNQPVSEQLIKEILEAGMQAPSARNEQPWHFIVIDDRKIINKIPEFHPYADMLKEAPLAIIVCGDVNLTVDEGYAVIDCSSATENILLAIHAKGLGGVWLGIYPRKERIAGIRELLSLPDHILPVSLISLGYPAEQKPFENRYDELKIHHNKW